MTNLIIIGFMLLISKCTSDTYANQDVYLLKMMNQVRSQTIQTFIGIVKEQLRPLKQAIELILNKLNIDFNATSLQTAGKMHRKRRRRRSKKKQSQTKKLPMIVLEKEDSVLQGLDELESIDETFNFNEFQSTQQCRTGRSQKDEQFVFPQPRGNNSSFNLLPLPQTAPLDDIAPQNQAEWSRLYMQVKRLLQGKQAKKQRGWFDFQKKMIVQLVTKGTKFGGNVNKITQMIGVSNGTLKRWKNYFK